MSTNITNFQNTSGLQSQTLIACYCHLVAIWNIAAQACPSPAALVGFSPAWGAFTSQLLARTFSEEVTLAPSAQSQPDHVSCSGHDSAIPFSPRKPQVSPQFSLPGRLSPDELLSHSGRYLGPLLSTDPPERLLRLVLP